LGRTSLELCSREYSESLRLVEAGLVANPNDWLLLNNQAFALASLGRVSEAEATFRKILIDQADVAKYSVWRATRGLLHFRRGRIAQGREDYAEAIRTFEKRGLLQSAAIAAVYLAREEMIAGENAKPAVERAAKLAKSVKLIEAEDWIRDLRDAITTGGRPPQTIR